LVPIRQGLYRVSRPNARIEPELFPIHCNPLYVASKVSPQGYIGFLSALEFNVNPIRKLYKNTIFIVSDKKFNRFSFENYNYFWCQNPNFTGVDSYTLQTENKIHFEVKISNFEKSIVDCVKRLAHATDFHEFREICKNSLNSPNEELILKYCTEANTAAVFNRIGFFFESMKGFWHISELFLKSLENNMSTKNTSWDIGAEQLQENNQVSDSLAFYGEIKNRWKITQSLQKKPNYSVTY
jgi:predicted transcriptional regulator of viral defense system